MLLQFVKKLIDEYHKVFISEALEGLHLDLSRFKILYSIPSRSADEEKEFEECQKKLRKQIVDHIKEDERFENLFNEKFITEEMVHFCVNEDDRKLLDEFSNFTSYFTGFFDNRKNMYSEEENSSAIAFRIINQNLPKFIDNKRVLDNIAETPVRDSILIVQDEMKDILNNLRVEDYFSIDNYEKIVSNEEITAYNSAIGGYVTKEGKKIQGINEYVNLYNQKNSTVKGYRRIPKLRPLYKQILADRESISFVDEQFESDQEVLDTIQQVLRELDSEILDKGAPLFVGKICAMLKNVDLNRIYLRNGIEINSISNRMYGDWAIIKTALENRYDRTVGIRVSNRNEKYYEKRSKAIKNQKSYSIGELNDALAEKATDGNCVQDYFIKLGEGINGDGNLLDAYNEKRQQADSLFGTSYASKHGLKSDRSSTMLLKGLLDSIIAIVQFVKPLCGTGMEADKSEEFYGEFTAMYEKLCEVIPLYNKVRNYITQKPYSTEKIKLNFSDSQLMQGWDQNKERDDLGIILEKNGCYYLGIMNKHDNKIFDGDIPVSDDNYRKMVYKLLPGPNKMLPKVFFSKKNNALYAPSDDIMEKYEKGTHKKGDLFNINDCHNLIDFFKESIEKNQDWKAFNFNFTNTSDYDDISGFYHEVEKQGYSVKFQDVSADYISEMVRKGYLYLFQIYNKDFSKYSKGRPNLHTIYWKMLFDQRNLENVVYKLNGQAEIFYRKASIDAEDKVIHPKNIPVANKNTDVITHKPSSIFAYDLIKDRRYTVDKFEFHVPITMNFCANGHNRLNQSVYQTIRDNPGMHVIGIDRGERNLLYVSVIDPDGRIVYQESMNVIENDKGNYKQNYHGLLEAREVSRESERKNWNEIESIKELKEGYLSQVIHKIIELMIKYQAIVVMEDLNFGFMNSRKKVEKQVYQKFEKMLIDKLNYYIDKTKDPDEYGGALHALQLTNCFDSFKTLGKQSGFLFYIPAWNTSKLDPTTGFVNLIYPKYVSIAEAKKFWGKFEKVRYNSEAGYYEFSFNYGELTDRDYGIRDEWTVCSYGTRVVNFRDKDENGKWNSKEVDITAELSKLMDKYNINTKCDDMKEQYLEIDEKDFWVLLMHDFGLVLQMRNSVIGSDIDYMLSPVKNAQDTFFDTRKTEIGLPYDADANGAYNIARKGLWAMERIRAVPGDKINLAISNQEWLKYAQEHPLIKAK